MQFLNEQSVEDYIRRLISQHITSKNQDIFTLNSKTISDVVICRNFDPPAIFFLEVKCYQPSHGRLGIGTSCGKGIQPEVLRRRPKYLESRLRWLMCRADRDSLFWLVTSETLCSFVSGGTIAPKQNNINPSIFEKIPGLSEEALLRDMHCWLES